MSLKIQTNKSGPQDFLPHVAIKKSKVGDNFVKKAGLHDAWFLNDHSLCLT